MKALRILLSTALLATGCSKIPGSDKLSAAQQALGVPTGVSSPSLENVDLAKAVDAGMELTKAVALSDSEVKGMALQFANYSDQQNKVAGANSRYTQRLNRLTKDLTNYDGLNLKFKVYLSPEVNAFALADGNVRVYSGLMDQMKDDELLAVIGHEIGHVKLQHTDRRFRVAYAASGLRKAVASSNSTAGVLAETQVGGLFEKFLNAQFSQSQEEASDSYGLRMLVRKKKNGQGAVNALYKLAKLEGQESDEVRLLSSHPSPRSRAQRLAEELAELKQNPAALEEPIVTAKADTAVNTAPAAASTPAKSVGKSATMTAPVTREAPAEVESPAVPPQRAATPQRVVQGRWYVQLSAETDPANAERKVQALRGMGFSATTQEAVVNGTTYFRVLAGPFQGGRDAEANVSTLQQTGLADGRPFARRLQ